VVSGCHRKDARHGAELEGLLDIPVITRLLRERFEEAGATVVVKPSKPENAVHSVAKRFVAASDHAEPRLDRVWPYGHQLLGIKALEVRVVEKVQVDTASLDVLERQALLWPEKPCWIPLDLLVSVPQLLRMSRARLIEGQREGVAIFSKIAADTHQEQSYHPKSLPHLTPFLNVCLFTKNEKKNLSCFVITPTLIYTSYLWLSL